MTTIHCKPLPTTGVPFIGEGRVIIEDSIGLTVEPVCGRMALNASGEVVWYLGGTVVRQYLDAELHLDRWATAPPSGSTFAWLREPRVVHQFDCDGEI